MKHLISFVLFLILSQNCIANGTQLENKIQVDTIVYSIQSFNSVITLSLLSNNEFIQTSSSFDCVGSVFFKQVLGKYLQKGNKFQLIPKEVKNQVFGLEKTEKEVTVSYEKSGLNIKTNYYQVEVNKKHYLLSDEFKEEYEANKSKTNDFQELVKNRGKRDGSFGAYFSTKEKPRRIFIIDDLPKQWRELLQPLTVKVYKIQLGVFRDPPTLDKSILKLGTIDYLVTEIGMFVVLLGEYKTYEAAKIMEKKIKVQGKDAMVIAFRNGEKVPL